MIRVRPEGPGAASLVWRQDWSFLLQTPIRDHSAAVRASSSIGACLLHRLIVEKQDETREKKWPGCGCPPVAGGNRLAAKKGRPAWAGRRWAHWPGSAVVTCAWARPATTETHAPRHAAAASLQPRRRNESSLLIRSVSSPNAAGRRRISRIFPDAGKSPSTESIRANGAQYACNRCPSRCTQLLRSCLLAFP